MADGSNQGSSSPPPARGLGAVKAHISSRPIEFGLFITRILTVFFAFNYFLPVLAIFGLGGSPYSSYYKALMASAATSALRLHQRMPNFRMSTEFLQQLFLEDSAHYLIYSVLFINSEPLTVVLMPVGLFATLHGASYALALLDAAGQNNAWLARTLISLVELQSRNILRMVAFTEIFIMPLTVVMIFMGRVALFTPFLYYRFLCMRYASRRNPYTRAMFYETRMALDQAASSPKCPQGVRNMVWKFTAFVGRMAPPMEPQNAQ